MTLVSQIITDAYREGNLIPITQTPTAAEQTEALRLFNRFIKSVYGSDAGENFQPLAVGTNHVQTTQAIPTYDYSNSTFLPLNTRLVCNLTEAVAINLHPRPQDGSRLSVSDASSNFATYNLTLNGNGSKIDGDFATTLATNGQSKEWFYTAETSSWNAVTNLTESSIFPFPTEFEDLFTIGLAMRLNPRNGIEIDGQTLANYKRQLAAFKARYRQTRQKRTENGLWILPSNPWTRYGVLGTVYGAGGGDPFATGSWILGDGSWGDDRDWNDDRLWRDS